MRFAFEHATRDSIDPLAFGAAMIASKLRTSHPLISDGNRYYLVTAVIRSSAIRISLEGDQTKCSEAHRGSGSVVEVNGEVKVEKHSDVEI